MSRLGVITHLAPIILAAAVLPAQKASVVVVSEPGVEAYDEAIRGVGSALPKGSFRVMDAAAKTFDAELAAALDSGETRVVIAVGSRSLAEVRRHHPSMPIVSAMVLNAGDSDVNLRRVDLEVPLAAQLAAMRTLWPGRTRMGIIRRPSQAGYSSASVEPVARKEGFSVVVEDCDGPAHLLKALASLKGKVDFVLCPPDGDLYNAVTIKPLVLASLEQRLPLVGFSSAFVRAGAAAGIFPDYVDVGRQAAETAIRAVQERDRQLEKQGPRKILVAVNQRVARLLGVAFRPEAVAAEVYK